MRQKIISERPSTKNHRPYLLQALIIKLFSASSTISHNAMTSQHKQQLALLAIDVSQAANDVRSFYGMVLLPAKCLV